MRCIIKKILFILFLFLCLNCKVNAENYYYNKNGGVLSKSEYDSLINVFDESYLNELTQNGLDELKDWDIVYSTSEEKVFRIDSFYDNYGNVISTTSVEIDKSEVSEILDEVNIKSRANSDTHTTSMKKITLELNVSSTDEIAVILKNEWLSIPSVKSYDIIAFRPISNYTYEGINTILSKAYQKCDGTTYNYNLSTSSNVVKTPIISGTGGYGVSMNIPDSASSSLTHHLTVVYNFVEESLTNSKYFIVEGTYQHATSSVSLSDSTDYTFGATGMGGVLVFDSTTVKNKYDNTAGLHVQFQF